MLRKLAVPGLLILLLGAAACRREAAPTPTPTQSLTRTVTPVTALALTPQAQPSPTATMPLRTSTPAPSPTATPVRTPTADPAALLGVVRQGGRLGDIWNLADIRHSVSPERVRVVWEMKEKRDSAPRFQIVEVDNQTVLFPGGPGGQKALDPSWGKARLDLVISDLYAYDFPLQTRLPIVPSDNPVVIKVGPYPTYDDALLGFSIGLKRPANYQVTTLTNPVRIVVDVVY
jgi:hypothetical protein